MGGGGVQVGQVAVEDPHGRAPRADDLRVGEVGSGCDGPGRVDERRDATEVSAGVWRVAAREFVAQGGGLQGCDGHALAVDGVERADGVAEDEQAAGKAP